MHLKQYKPLLRVGLGVLITGTLLMMKQHNSWHQKVFGGVCRFSWMMKMLTHNRIRKIEKSKLKCRQELQPRIHWQKSIK